MRTGTILHEAKLKPGAPGADANAVTAVQIPLAEFFGWLEIPTATREEFEGFDEEQALAFLQHRFRRFVELGLNWDSAVVLAVQTDLAF